MSLPARIETIALCLFRHAGRVLVAEGRDPAKGESFWRPVGGHVEPGERSDETVAREVREELGAEVRAARLLGVLENRFTYRGEARHEIVFLYEASFADPSLHGRDGIEGREADGRAFRTRWVPVRDFQAGRERLYPEGTLGLLASSPGSGSRRPPISE